MLIKLLAILYHFLLLIKILFNNLIYIIPSLIISIYKQINELNNTLKLNGN